MMRFTVALLLSLLGFNSFACGDEQGHGRLGERYYMAMSPEAQERFVGKLHTLKKGMPSGKVIRVLGRPDGNNVLRTTSGSDFE